MKHFSASAAPMQYRMLVFCFLIIVTCLVNESSAWWHCRGWKPPCHRPKPRPPAPLPPPPPPAPPPAPPSYPPAPPAGPPGSYCHPINYHSICKARPYKVIHGIGGAFGAIANGNDVYITGYFNKNVYRYNSQVHGGTIPLETVRFPSGNPTFVDIHNGKLYVTSVTCRVYEKPLKWGTFRAVCGLIAPRSVGIKWSPDGQLLIVSEWNTRRVNVYNKHFQRIKTFTACSTYPREISFDCHGNIRITTYTCKVCLYNPHTYHLLAAKRIPGASKTEGYYVHCDGTIVMADRGGKLHFLDSNYRVLRTITGFSSLGDVALTSDGTMYVTDLGASKIYLYKVY